MAEITGIEWADHTFNPWIGCTKVSPACDHCYAEDWAKRFKGPAWGKERRRTSAANWKQPLKWNREAPAFRAIHGRAPMVFCASLADVFDNQVPEGWRRDLWGLIDATPDLTWLLLTKRPQNIAKMLPEINNTLLCGRPYLPNVWLGTTVENQAEADRRIPHLLSVPAAKRFLSCEPLLGPVDLHMVRRREHERDRVDALTGVELMYDPDYEGQPDEFAFVNVCGGPRIDWVIAGGESGREARPSHPDWFRSLRDRCAAAGVPFLFKQWGEWVPLGWEHAGSKQLITQSGKLVLKSEADANRDFPGTGLIEVRRVGKKAAGRTLDGVIHDGRPGA